MRLLRRRKQRTTALAFSRTDRLAVGGRVGPRSGRVDVWHIPAGDRPTALPPLDVPPGGLAFTPDGGLLVGLPSRVVLFSGPRLQTAEVVREWNPDEYTLASFCPAGLRLVLDAATELRLIDLRPPFPEVWRRPASGMRVTPGMAAFSPGGERVAVKGEHSVEVRDAATGTPVAAFDRPAPTERWFGFRLLWSPDGRWVGEVWQQWVNVWDAGSGCLVFQRVARSDEWINDAAFHPSSGRLAVAVAGRTDGVVHLYSAGDWQEVVSYSWPVGRVGSLAFHPDGGLAATGGDRPEVVVWDVDW